MAHIGIDARLTAYRTGGISTYTRRIVEEMARRTLLHRITVLHSRKARERVGAPLSMAHLWTPPHHRLERLALSAELLPHRLDLLHSTDFIPPLRGAKRHIITVHDLTFLRYPQYLTADSRRYYNDQIGRAVAQADHILSVSHATKADLVQMLNVPEAKISVQWHGVEPAFRPLLPEATRTRLSALGLPKSYILHVGTWEPRKNLLGLAQAYQQLQTQHPETPPLLFVGRVGWFYETMRAEIDALQLGDALIWRDNITDIDLPTVYNGAELAVTTSFYEGFGMPALEAMACGVPVAVCNRSSLPEVVGDVGITFNPDDPNDIANALYHALTDAGWRNDAIASGIIRAHTFTWEQCVTDILAAYERLL